MERDQGANGVAFREINIACAVNNDTPAKAAGVKGFNDSAPYPLDIPYRRVPDCDLAVMGLCKLSDLSPYVFPQPGDRCESREPDVGDFSHGRGRQWPIRGAFV